MLLPQAPVSTSVAALCCAVAVCAPAAGAPAAGLRSFNLPRGDAAVTLKQFSAAAGTPIVYLVDRVRGATTNAVRGEFAPREALERMLAGSGLEAAEDTATGALVVSRKPARGGRTRFRSATQPKHQTHETIPDREARRRVGRTHQLNPDRPDPELPAVPTPEETVILNPFEVISTDDRGYQAANTSAPRAPIPPSAICPCRSTSSPSMLMIDRALFDLDQVVDVIPGTARVFNEFVPQVNIRGFDSSAAMRNGVRGLTTPDMTSIARVETVKGPAALLYGQTQPGGVINYITKNPSTRRSATVRLSAGSESLRRAELDATGPINKSKPSPTASRSQPTAWRRASANGASTASSSPRWCSGNRSPGRTSSSATATPMTTSARPRASRSSPPARSTAAAIRLIFTRSTISIPPIRPSGSTSSDPISSRTVLPPTARLSPLGLGARSHPAPQQQDGSPGQLRLSQPCPLQYPRGRHGLGQPVDPVRSDNCQPERPEQLERR